MRGVVAAGNPHTAEAASVLLRAGGNAVDAACAAAFATFVAEPLLSSAGGAGLATVALRDHDPLLVDFFSFAPGLGRGRPKDLDFQAIAVDFGPATQIFHVGRGAAAVPLALPGLAETVRRFGRKTLPEICAPAIAMARAGVPLTKEGADVFVALWEINSRDRQTVALHSDDGLPPPIGRLMRNPALADTLTEYAREGRLPGFVRDGLLEEFGVARGGLVTEEDLAGDVGVAVIPPLRVSLGEWEVFTSPHPGGILVGRIVEALAQEAPPGDQTEEILRFARASRAAHLDRTSLTTPGSTTHVSVVDADGGACAITLTNGEGSGHLVPGTGIQVNNFLGEEDLNPHGFHLHAPGAKLPTMMAPTVVLYRGVPVFALGSGGANRIRSAVSQVLYHVAVRGRALEDAIARPRVHAETNDAWVELEGLDDPAGVVAALESELARVHAFPERSFFFGGVHSVLRADDGTFVGVGDARRGGVALTVL